LRPRMVRSCASVSARRARCHSALASSACGVTGLGALSGVRFLGVKPLVMRPLYLRCAARENAVITPRIPALCFLSLALALGAACVKSAPPAPGGDPRDDVDAAATPAQAAVAARGAATEDARDAAAFAQQWARAIAQPDADVREQAALAMADQWRGHRYTWTGLALADLCTARCALVVFTGARMPQGNELRGSLPQVVLDEAARAALHAGCAGASSCVVQFDAELVDVQTDPGAPVVLRFDHMHVLAAHPPRPDEPWFAATPPQPAREVPLHHEQPLAAPLRVRATPHVF
jgi:hypothetical protein